ncbi:MAG: TonB-dependent receptor domain-containing protein [Alistipes sp.]
MNPEYTTQYNLGVTYAKNFDGVLRRIDFQADAYYSEVDDKIVASPPQPVPVDDDQPRSRGNTRDRNDRADRLAVQSVTFNARLNYTYQKAQDVTDRTSEWYGGQIPISRGTAVRVLNLGYRGWDLVTVSFTPENATIRREHHENYARPWYTHDMALSKYPVQKNGAAHHRRSEQHLQPTIRSRTMLPDAGHEF